MFSDIPNVNPQSTVRKVRVTQGLISQSLYLLTKGNKSVVISTIASDTPLLSSRVDERYVCVAVVTLDTGLLARSQYSEGPATGHLDTGFS